MDDDKTIRHQWDALVAENARLRAERDRLRAALEAVYQYGSDTLSGPSGRPDDREWQREGVLVMTRRARAALEGSALEDVLDIVDDITRAAKGGDK